MQVKQNKPYYSRWCEILLGRLDSCLNVTEDLLPWGCSKKFMRTLVLWWISLTSSPSALSAEGTASLQSLLWIPISCFNLWGIIVPMFSFSIWMDLNMSWSWPGVWNHPRGQQFPSWLVAGIEALEGRGNTSRIHGRIEAPREQGVVGGRIQHLTLSHREGG